MLNYYFLTGCCLEGDVYFLGGAFLGDFCMGFCLDILPFGGFFCGEDDYLGLILEGDSVVISFWLIEVDVVIFLSSW